MAQAVLEFRAVTKRFSSVPAVDHIGFTIQSGEIFTLLGPSGCGKTTTLRLVAGLEEPDEGEILVDGTVVAAPQQGIFVAPDKRRLGMVFQSYAVWPHLTVFENVAFPLRVRRTPMEIVRQRVGQALASVGLAGFAERGATQLSGGQQQRVALARALVYAPAILLLDEPLSNLDAKLREQMRFELRELQQRLKLTVLYVTHDQTEAMTLSDRIAVVHDGRFEQVGTAEEVYETPATAFVSEFLGRQVTFDGTVRENGGKRRIELAGGDRPFGIDADAASAFSDGTAVRLFTRPEDIEIMPAGESSPHQLEALIERVDYLGDRFEYQVRTAGARFVVPAPKKERHAVGARVCLRFDLKRLSIHPRR